MTDFPSLVGLGLGLGRLADVVASKFKFENLVFITFNRLVVVMGKIISITKSKVI